MVLDKQSCENCIGLESCLKYCDIRVGENIVNFVNGIDSVESKIGEIHSGKDFGGFSDIKATDIFMTTGITLHKNYSPTNVITKAPTNGMVVQGKLGNCDGKSPIQLLKKYTSYCKLPAHVQNKAADDLKKFNSNRVIPTPFKAGTDIEVVHKGFDGKTTKTLTTVEQIKYNINTAGALEGMILADVGRTDTGSSYAKVKLSEYGTSWFLPNLERNLKTSEITYEAIRMNNMGLIDAIEVTDGTNTIAVDSQHMYLAKKGSITIIGDWGDSGMKENPEIMGAVTKTKAYKKMKTYMRFIEKHRRFIIPYGLSEVNKIQA